MLYVMAHGAGAGMEHPFMESMADALARHELATFRYQFPYMEQGRRRPDPAHLLTATVQAALETAARRAPDLPRLAGGKSMGGRMTSQAAAQGGLPELLGVAFLGFPLHPAGRPGTDRAGHLRRVEVPMLFVQGSRDRLAQLELLLPIGRALGARVHVIENADHSFHVPKRSGLSDQDVREEIAGVVADWSRRQIR